jgi:RNA polymerase sigma-70 factor (ECF subfamily)
MMEEREFREIYSRCAGEVFTYALRRLSPADAEDLVADVFLVAWRRRGELPSDPLPWLFGVARLTLSNRRRTRDRANALVQRLGQEAMVSGASEVADVDVGVLTALSLLAEDDQDLLEFLAWEGLSRSQLAAVFGVSRGVIGVRIYRARRRLARVLAQRSGDTTIAPDELSARTEADHA